MPARHKVFEAVAHTSFTVRDEMNEERVCEFILI